MKKGRFTEDQIIGILKEHEAGRKVPELAREIGVSEGTIYTWKSKYGMEVNEAQRLKGLEDENRRLKHLVADLSLDKEVLKAVIAFGVNSAAQAAKHVAQRPDHEFLFFSMLLQFTPSGRDLGLLLPRQRCALTPQMRTEV